MRPKIIDARVEEVVPLGRLGENEVRIIRFDIKWVHEEFPGADITLLNQRSKDPGAYPVDPQYYTIEGDYLLWTIQSGDVAYFGSGLCEYTVIVNNQIEKSVIFTTFTDKALDGNGNPPDPWRGWQERIKEDADRAEESAESAGRSAESASESAGSASSSAESASRDALSAQESASAADNSASDSEAWAVGKRKGVPVEEGDDTYDNNAEYYAEQAAATLNGKANKVSGATSGNFAELDASGDLKDSGKSASDFVETTRFLASQMPISLTDQTTVKSAIETLEIPFNGMVGTITQANPATSEMVLCSLNFNTGTYTPVAPGADGKRVCMTDFLGTDVISVDVASDGFRLGLFYYSRSTGDFVGTLTWLSSYNTFDHETYKYRLFGRTNPDGNTSVEAIAGGLVISRDTPSGSADLVVDALERKIVTGTSIKIANASKGTVLSCVGTASAKVESLNLCSYQTLTAYGRVRAPLDIGTLEAGVYTLTAECTTDNPNISKCRVLIAGRIAGTSTWTSVLGTIKCDGSRDFKTFTLSNTYEEALLYLYASTTDLPADYTGYTATMTNIVLSRGTTSQAYEPYESPVTYAANDLNSMKLTEYTNIITSAASLVITYLVRNSYANSILGGFSFGLSQKNLHYVTPEMFGAAGDGLRNDVAEINACIAYAISKGLCVKAMGNYRVNTPIIINGDNANIEINNVDYYGEDYAVQFQGIWGQLRVNKIISTGGGLLIHGTTGHTRFDTFYVGQIKAAMHGVRFRLNGAYDCFGHAFFFDEIRAGKQYYCIYLAKEPDATTGNLNEIKLWGGYVWDGLWGIVGNLGGSIQINVHTENLGTDGNGGAIWSTDGGFPRLFYARFGEIVNHNTAIKISGTFVKSSVGEANLRVTLPSIDITELEPLGVADMSSDNAVIGTDLIVQDIMQSARVLTRNLRIWGNRFQFPQHRKNICTFTEDLDMTDQYYTGDIPYRFIADGDIRVDLHPSYAANCINEFEVKFGSEDSIVVYDFLGNKVFDSEGCDPGIYKICAYVDGDAPLAWDLANQLWEITKISIPSADGVSF